MNDGKGGESAMYSLLKNIIVSLFLMNGTLFAIDISLTKPVIPLLKDASTYLDYNRSETVDTIVKKPFHRTEKEHIGFGYSPKFAVWIRIELTNPSGKSVRRIIEYANPLTSIVALYDGLDGKCIGLGGIGAQEVIKSINPAFSITLKAHESKVFYLKAVSDVTTLIVGLNLWQVDAFYQHESQKQFFMALFFGAMLILLLYNFIIWLSVREKVYLYYVLAFTGIVFHHFFYKGLAELYLLSPQMSLAVVQYAAFIVAAPVFFMALLAKEIMRLQQYPRINRFLTVLLVLFVIATGVCYWFGLNRIRSLFPVLMLFILIGITIYAYLKKNRQAKFVLVGWFILMVSALFMFLSSEGYLDITDRFPYYAELSILIETLLFSLILADRLKQLRLEKLQTQRKLIQYQEEEEVRLTALVSERTKQLEASVREKELLLQELNHRVKNSIQTIVSFLRLQIDETEEPLMRRTLLNVENRIMSISHLYALLYEKHNLNSISAYEYFSLLCEHVQTTLGSENVNVHIDTDVHLDPETMVYCGFIVNEALTNALQYAFAKDKSGDVSIILSQRGQNYILIIKDNGKGFDMNGTRQSMGLLIMESLAAYQLKGSMQINTASGTEIAIIWEENDA